MTFGATDDLVKNKCSNVSTYGKLKQNLILNKQGTYSG